MVFLSFWQSAFQLLILVIVQGSQFDFVLNDEIEFAAPNDTVSSSAQLSRDSLLWGPYRSGYYFGIRPRLPHSLILGLLWFNADDHGGLKSIRHEYEQHHKMDRANWVQFDPRFGGRQEIIDKDCHITITIDFLKSKNGLNWAVKIKATPHQGYEKVTTSFVWYSGLEGENKTDKGLAVSGFLKLDNEYNENGYKDTLEFSGFSEDLGLFELKMNDGGMGVKNVHPAPVSFLPENLNPQLTHHLSLRIPDGNVWRGKDIFLTLLEGSLQELTAEFSDRLHEVPPYAGLVLRDLHHYEGNMHFVQKTYQGACEFDITYNVVNAEESQRISFESLPKLTKQVREKISLKFSSSFNISSKPKQEQKFARELMSGLLGGLSYFYGDQLVDRTTSLDVGDLPVDEDGRVTFPKLEGVYEGPHELFSLVPSRPFFPRGFYWDEGFHILPLLKYDTDLAMEIFKSWFSLIDNTGWIAREQILGDEARARVPPDFIVQSDSVVNPPTLMLAFTQFLELAEKRTISDQGFSEQIPLNLDSFQDSSPQDHNLVIINHPELLFNYAREIYARLKAHYHSFRESQKGEVDEFGRGPNQELYRWRGRTTTHSLASGLDDYPRVLPIDIAELNVDLLCWVGVMNRSMRKIAEILHIDSDVEAYKKTENDIIESIASMHWSEKDKTYCDVSVDEDDQKVFACFKGYISLFPFLTRFIPVEDVTKLGYIVDLLADPEELASDFGIRSISKSSEFYRTGENYWRSPVWININYLVLESLTHYHLIIDEYSVELKERMAYLYANLRKQLINNVKREWKKTGFVWEQYDDETGRAKGAKNFLGWSSLILLAIEMPETLT